MNDIMEFTDREEFRKWLNDNCLTSEGVWLLFGKEKRLAWIVDRLNKNLRPM